VAEVLDVAIGFFVLYHGVFWFADRFVRVSTDETRDRSTVELAAAPQFLDYGASTSSRPRRRAASAGSWSLNR